MKLEIKKGTTSKRIAIFIQNSSVTTGAGLTGLVFNSAGLTWYYWRENEGNVAATAVTLATATRGTYASGGFIEKDATNLPGFYEIGIPDAALATGADWVVMQIKGATNMAPLTLEIQLVDNIALDIFSRIGAPAGASMSADVAAVKTETASIQTDTNDLQTQIGTAGAGLTTLVNLIWDELTAEARTAGSYGQLFKDNVNATISSRSSHTAADVWAVATRALTDKVDFALTAADKAAIVNLVYDELTAEARTAGSFGQLLKDNLNATVSSRAIPGDLMGIVAGGITAAKFAAGAIDAAAIAADAIGASELATDAVNEIRDAVWAKAFAELAQAIPAATPSAEAAIMLVYMALRNKLDITATEKKITNDAGVVVAKKALTDDSVTYSEGKMVSGP